MIGSRTATQGAVAAGHPETVRAAQIALEEGGNAFDAVLAGMAAACVVEPVLSSLGGGGFLMARPADGEAVLYDFFAQTPKTHPASDDTDFYPVLCDFGTVQQEFHIGMASIATPGAVRGLFEINRDLGRMPLKRIIEPALTLARDGFKMNRLQAYIFGVVGGIYLSTEASRAIFCSKEEPENLVREGETVSNPAFADALDSLAIEGDELFYFGEIAARIDEDCRSGGTLTRADLEAYRMERRSPLSLDYGDARLFTNPPPSTGGILIAFALELIKGIGWGQAEFGSSAHLSRLVRVMELTNTARVESRLHQADGENAANTLLDSALLDTYRNKVLEHPKSMRGTTHISVIDGDGNAAALTLSNGEGAGYIVPGTGIMMNNMLGEEDINPHGFHKWPTDSRMCSMMAPSLVAGRDGELIALGSGGSNRIRTAILQVLCNIIDFGMPIEAAINSPRVHFEADRLSVESGLDPDQISDLVSNFSDYKLWDERNLFFGGVHAARFDPSSGDFGAAGDPRRGGSATVL